MGMSDYMASLRARVGNDLLEVPAVTLILRDDDGRILLVKHADEGTWTTPGGAIEPLETPADAAVREMWEETGLHVELVRLAGVFGGEDFVTRYSNGDRTSYAMMVFEVRVLSGEPRPDGEETLDVRFFAPEELADQNVPVWLPEVVRAVTSDPPRSFRPTSWSPPSA